MPPRKDPNKPKGRTSAYAYFVQDRRECCKEEGRTVQFSEFSRECADKWKETGEAARVKYDKLAETDRDRYRREMADYKPPSDEEESGGKRRRKRKVKKPKDLNKPKRSMSGFMFFSSDKRPKLKEQDPKAGVGAIAKQLGAAWKIMTDEQKKPYEDQSKRDRKRYERDMELYRSGKYVRDGQNPHHEEPQEEVEEASEEEEDEED